MVPIHYIIDVELTPPSIWETQGDVLTSIFSSRKHLLNCRGCLVLVAGPYQCALDVRAPQRKASSVKISIISLVDLATSFKRFCFVVEPFPPQKKTNMETPDLVYIDDDWFVPIVFLHFFCAFKSCTSWVAFQMFSDFLPPRTSRT